LRVIAAGWLRLVGCGEDATGIITDFYPVIGPTVRVIDN